MVGEMNDFTSPFSCCIYVIIVHCVYAVSYLIHGFGWVVGSLVLVRNLPLFEI